MKSELAESTPLTPEQFRASFTVDYQFVDSDSPVQSRSFMIEKILAKMRVVLQKSEFRGNYRKINVLSLAAGKQVLEQEITTHPYWQQVENQVNLFTLDLAQIPAGVMKYDPSHHIEANGVALPFGESSFNIINSNMAVDFMPKEDAFREIARALKPDGVFMANLHHPRLVASGKIEIGLIKNKIRSLNQKLRHGPQSRKTPVTRQELDIARWELTNAQFKVNNLPSHIFCSTQAIQDFLEHDFTYSHLLVEECKTVTNNWFYLETEGMKLRGSPVQ